MALAFVPYKSVRTNVFVRRSFSVNAKRKLFDSNDNA